MKTVPLIVEHRCPVSNEDDFISAEVQFSEIKPERGQFEVILTDSDDMTSSECGTPVQRRLQVLPSNDVRSSVSPSFSTPPRVHSPAGSDVIVYGAEQWKDSRREVLEASKPRPSGWLWMESQASDSKHSGETVQVQNNSGVNSTTECNKTANDGPGIRSSTGTTTANDELGIRGSTGTTSNVTNNFSRSNISCDSRHLENVPVGVKTEERQSVNSSQSKSYTSRPVAITHVKTSSAQNTNCTTSFNANVASDANSCGLLPRPVPPQRVDSVRPLEVSRTSRSHEIKMSSTTLSSRESQQSTKSQYYSESFEYSQSTQSSNNEHSRQELRASCPTGYRVPVEDGRLQGHRYTAQYDSVEHVPRQTDPRQLEPAAVDALFTYHHMPSTTTTTLTSSLTARCNPAAKTSPTTENSVPTSPTILRTHF